MSQKIPVSLSSLVDEIVPLKGGFSRDYRYTWVVAVSKIFMEFKNDETAKWYTDALKWINEEVFSKTILHISDDLSVEEANTFISGNFDSPVFVRRALKMQALELDNFKFHNVNPKVMEVDDVDFMLNRVEHNKGAVAAFMLNNIGKTFFVLRW